MPGHGPVPGSKCHAHGDARELAYPPVSLNVGLSQQWDCDCQYLESRSGSIVMGPHETASSLADRFGML